MAASPVDGILAQLADLFGKTSVRIRNANEAPPRVYVIDVISTITGKDARHSAQEARSLCSQYPEVDQMLVHFRFPGRGQRETPVVDVRGIVEVTMLLPGKHAAQVRRQTAELLGRYLGGDVSLVDEL